MGGRAYGQRKKRTLLCGPSLPLLSLHPNVSLFGYEVYMKK
jgi:hypothetical protein